MSEKVVEAAKQVERPVPVYLGLGAVKKRERPVREYKHYILPTIDVQLDKETGNTNVVKTGERDIYQEIQSCKDQAGFEAMYQKLQSGKAVPEDFADDGKHGFDVSTAPDNINDAYRRELAAAEEAAKAKENLGIKGDVPADKIQEIVDARMKEIIEGYRHANDQKIELSKKVGNSDEAK